MTVEMRGGQRKISPTDWDDGVIVELLHKHLGEVALRSVIKLRDVWFSSEAVLG